MVKKSNGDVKVITLQPKKAKREETSVNAILNAITSFLEYLNRTEDFKAIDMTKEARGRNFKGFLHHISKGKSYKKIF